MEPALRVAIYRDIPDIAGDNLAGLKSFIESKFEKETGKKIFVSTEADPYDLESYDKYLGDSTEAYDVMEVDTILLGELVEAGHLQPLDGLFKVSEDEYTATAVRSVKYCCYSEHGKRELQLYGVPTLHCANFLAEIVDNDHQHTIPLLQEWDTFDQLKSAFNQTTGVSKFPALAGNFRGSWVLPLFYLEGYLDKHHSLGETDLLNAIEEGLDEEVIKNLKDFVAFGLRPNGKNPCVDGEFKREKEKFLDDVIRSKHALVYGYAENIGEILGKSTGRRAYAIVSPPFGKSNRLLTCTDAVVVNKFKYADPKRAELIVKFVRFFTELQFRKDFAFGDHDLPLSNSPRYVLPACKKFYSDERAAKDKIYQQFNNLLQRAVRAPNHGLYGKRIDLKERLEVALGMPAMSKPATSL